MVQNMVSGNLKSSIDSSEGEGDWLQVSSGIDQGWSP